jgi:hypothetical protein
MIGLITLIRLVEKPVESGMAASSVPHALFDLNLEAA